MPKSDRPMRDAVPQRNGDRLPHIVIQWPIKKMKKIYEFAIPGAVGYEKIEANNQQEAEAIADSMCANHSFLGGGC